MKQDQVQTSLLPKENKPKKPKRKAETMIDDLAGVFADPIILHHAGDRIPTWLRQSITRDRLILLIKHEYNIATDSEACAYLMSASLDFPLSYEWTEIYLYAATQTCLMAGKEISDDIRVDKLDHYHMGMLIDLKRSIYQKRKGVRPRRERRKKDRGSCTTSFFALASKVKPGSNARAPKRRILFFLLLGGKMLVRPF